MSGPRPAALRPCRDEYSTRPPNPPDTKPDGRSTVVRTTTAMGLRQLRYQPWRTHTPSTLLHPQAPGRVAYPPLSNVAISPSPTCSPIQMILIGKAPPGAQRSPAYINLSTFASCRRRSSERPVGHWRRARLRLHPVGRRKRCGTGPGTSSASGCPHADLRDSCATEALADPLTVGCPASGSGDRHRGIGLMVGIGAE